MKEEIELLKIQQEAAEFKKLEKLKILVYPQEKFTF